MGFFNYEQIDQMHVELTNACNAACPMCARFHNNSPLIRPEMEIEQITLEQFKAWFPPEFLRKLKIVLFCGTVGDPGMAKDLYEICEYIAESNPESCVRLHTNGGMRKEDWWAKFGALAAKQRQDSWKWQVIFSVDGLEDTNHIYRRNVDWTQLVKNIKAFTSAGGSADQDFLIFKHNEHQIEEARAFAKELGIGNFIPKKALGVDNGNALTPMPALNRQGELDYLIYAPTEAKNRNLNKEDAEYINVLPVRPFSYEEYKKLKENKDDGKNFKERVKNCMKDAERESTPERNNAEIMCKARTMTNGVEIFVDNRGYILPCCYMGTHLNGTHTDFKYLQLHHTLDNYGWDKFSLKHHTVKEIIDAGHLNKAFADTWELNSVKEGKMAYCADTCGMYSAVDKIYTHEGMEDKSRLWRKLPEPK